jgi:Tol biopolymer transport system component
MRKLLILLAVTTTALAQQPKLLVPPGTQGWIDPVYSADGKLLAFARADRNEIRVLVFGEDSTRSVVRSDRVGRRFVFQPGDTRIVFRARTYALPGTPERLASTSIYLFDPVVLTADTAGDAFGPYLIENQLWYRRALNSVLLNMKGWPRSGGPCYFLDHGQLWVTNAHGDTVFASDAAQKFVGAEISPDGKWLAAVEEDNHAEQLAVIHMTDGKMTRFTGAFAPTWRADAAMLVCVLAQENGTYNLCTVDTATMALRIQWSSSVITAGTPAISPDGKRIVFVDNGGIYEVEIGGNRIGGATEKAEKLKR